MIPKYDADDIAFLRTVMPNMRSISGHHVALWSGVEDVFPDTKYFLFLRDPLKRGASHYQFHLDNDDYTARFGFRNFTWDQWVEWETHHNHQLKMISPDVDVDQAVELLESKNVFVGLTEHFDESLVMMKKLFSPELDIAYRRGNTARDNSLARSLLEDEEKREQIRAMYAKEFPLYAYARDTIFARYRREYGPTLDEDVERFRNRERDRVNRRRMLANRLYTKFVFLPRLKRRRRVYR
jgi:hypothetical protein